MKENLKRLRSSSGILMTSLVILLITAALVFLIRSGILFPHPGENEENPAETGALPLMENPAETYLIYVHAREKNPTDMLLDLREADACRWSFSYIEAWENNYTNERTAVLRQGEKYRIERENLLVICDGQRVYRREGMLENVSDADSTTFHLEAGLTSLDAIRNQLDGCTVEYDDPINPKYIRVSRSRDGYRDEYEISIETGFAVIERSYIGNMAYRMIMTDTVSTTGKDLPTDDDFRIPETD